MIILQRSHVESAGFLGGYRLGYREDAGKRRIVRHLLQQGRLADRFRIQFRGLRFGRVEHELNLAVLQGIDHIGSALQHFINLGAVESLCLEKALSAAGGADAEAQINELPDGRQYALLVGILDRDEDSPGEGHAHSGTQLALGKGNVVAFVDAHYLARRAHLGTQENVDAGEPVEGKNRFLYSHVLKFLGLQLEALQSLACHDARRYLGNRLADHLGDERHGA